MADLTSTEASHPNQFTSTTAPYPHSTSTNINNPPNANNKLTHRPDSITMCFYEQYVYQCRDWKWGNFKQHCQAEYRTGETCGMKMIWQSQGLQGNCKTCLKIEAKQRRRAKLVDDHNRWSREPHRYGASMEKALRDIKALDNEIMLLRLEKDDKYARVGNPRR
jgi:hypothetical protein